MVDSGEKKRSPQGAFKQCTKTVNQLATLAMDWQT